MKLKGTNLQKISQTEYNLNFGTIQLSSNGDRQVTLSSEESISELIVKTSCGSCTKASQERVSDKEFLININYKTSILGVINKKVRIYPKLEGSKNPEPTIVINLKGNVTKL